MRFICFFTLLIIGISCTRKSIPETHKLGKIEFHVTGKKEAQSAFERGLLLLHSFEFDDAEEAFQEAKSIDPDFVMAYWGEAMTHNHPLWRYQDKAAADSILNLLAPSPEARVDKAQTELEKDFIRGANLLFGDGTKTARDSSYADYLGTLYEKYPGNNEVAAFYGLALIGSVPVGRDVAVYGKAADIAKEVLSRNPEHPGALHYLIHAYDDPGHAALALNAADAYAVVAPDAGHALHMPSHIYVAAGLWDKVISSNEDSWAASKTRMLEKNLDNDALGYHAFHWLEYGYLQAGRVDDARKLVYEMQSCTDLLPSKRAREHLIYQVTTFLAETGDYTDSINEIRVDDEGLNIVTRAMQDFVIGMRAYQNGERTELDSIITRMDAERLREAELATGSGRLCSGTSYQNANIEDVQMAEVMALELKGMRAWMDKDGGSAEKYLQEATELENTVSYAYGPPTVVKPSWEMYGEWLLENHRNPEAAAQFESALKTAPNRRLASRGLEQAKSDS